jgi:mono/diheme cytochrome c family protein
MLALALDLALLACADNEESSPTYHADIAPILEGRCVGCHAQGGIGSFPLTSYAEVSAVAEVVAAVTEARTMPPWKAAPGHLDYSNDPSLTDAQIATIGAWVDAGAPEGDPAQAGEALAPVSVALPRTDVTLSVPEPYTPQLDPDDYRCFVMEWTEGTSYVTGFEVHPGNASIVHHVAAFLIRPDGLAGSQVLDIFRDWDASEEGPGYTCFGGPSKSGENLQVPVQQVAQWVPGGGATLFPAGVGIEVPEGSQIVLQMHYNTLSSDGNPDQSTLDLMIEPDVQRLGAFAPWLDIAWTFGGMVIPPGASVSYSAKDDPLGFFSLALGDDVDLSQGFDIHAAMLHMHKVGRSGSARLDRQDGSSQVIVEVPQWDFDWQLNYALAEPLPFVPGDELFVECSFENETDTAISWGEGSTEEMCVANLFVSAPK